MRVLQQSVTTSIPIGPFVGTTGISVLPSISPGSVNLDLYKHNNVQATYQDIVLGGAGTTNPFIPKAQGYYSLQLNATDLDIAGPALIVATVDGALPMWHEIMVQPAQPYDSIYGTDRLQVDVREYGDVNLDFSTVMKSAIGSQMLVGTIKHIGDLVTVGGGSLGFVSDGVIGSIGHVKAVASGAVGTISYVAWVADGKIGSVGHVASGYTMTVGTVTRVLSVGSIDTTAISGGFIGSIGYAGIVGSVGHVASGYTQTIGTVSRVLSVGSIDTTAITGGYIGSVGIVGTVGFTRGGIIGSVGFISDGLIGSVGHVKAVASGAVGTISYVSYVADGLIGTVTFTRGGIIGSVGHVAAIASGAVATLKDSGQFEDIKGSLGYFPNIVGSLGLIPTIAGWQTAALAELAQAAPSATPDLKAAIMLLYMAIRNQLTTTSTELGVYNDAGTKIAKKTLSDDGTTYTETEMISGA